MLLSSKTNTAKNITNAVKTQHINPAEYDSAFEKKIRGRIVEVMRPEIFKNSTVRCFLFCLSYNKNNAGQNESNFVKFTLKQENCALIENFKVGDMAVVRYTILGTNFESANGKKTYITNLIAHDIIKPPDDEVRDF